MGRAEMIILLGAIAILGRYSLTVNDALATNEIHVIQSEYELNAISIAESIFQQAWMKSFDEATVSGYPVSIPDDFEDAATLGPESGEVYPDIDDIDDFNELSLNETTDNGLAYNLAVIVGYVNAADKDTYIGTQSTLKRMDVRITSDYLRDTITFSRIYPYWR